MLKVCGMRESQNIREVEALGIDWMGFIFYPPSSRFVSEIPDYMPLKAKRVGVFVDADMEFVGKRVKDFGLDIIQLHGKESPNFCKQIKDAFPNHIIVKVFSISNEDSLAKTSEYEDVADYFLFDTQCKEKGGSGRMFDHSILKNYNGNTPFILSGGLSLDTIKEVKDFAHPKLVGYDINSKFEVAPALKNPQLIEQFISKLKNTL